MVCVPTKRVYEDFATELRKTTAESGWTSEEARDVAVEFLASIGTFNPDLLNHFGDFLKLKSQDEVDFDDEVVGDEEDEDDDLDDEDDDDEDDDDDFDDDDDEDDEDSDLDDDDDGDDAGGGFTDDDEE